MDTYINIYFLREQSYRICNGSVSCDNEWPIGSKPQAESISKIDLIENWHHSLRPLEKREEGNIDLHLLDHFIWWTVYETIFPLRTDLRHWYDRKFPTHTADKG